MDLHTLGFKGALVKKDELACTLVDVKQLLRACYDLMVVRLRLLDHDHVERSYHAACNFSSLRSRVPAFNREAFLATQLAAVLVGDDPLEPHRILDLLVPRLQTFLRLRGYVGLAPNNLSDPRFFDPSVRQARRNPERCRSFAVPSSSVSSDSQNFVGVSHGFLSLGTVLRARSVRVSLRNIS